METGNGESSIITRLPSIASFFVFGSRGVKTCYSLSFGWWLSSPTTILRRDLQRFDRVAACNISSGYWTSSAALARPDIWLWTLVNRILTFVIVDLPHGWLVIVCDYRFATRLADKQCFHNKFQESVWRGLCAFFVGL